MSDFRAEPDRQDLLAAELAEHHLIEEELGRGGSATVYLAQDLRHGRRVALKVLHSALGAALGVERFQREIRTHARLQHPHVLPLFDSGIAAGRLFYTMPYVEAGSLRDRLRRVGRLDTRAALQMALEVSSALAYAHALGIIHRDLKPENIMLSPTGEAILADFGIAYALEEVAEAAGADTPSGPRLTETGVTVGTPTYMSPEQAAGDEELTATSDQYSLAAVVYEALAGVAPFTGPNARAILARKLTGAAAPLKNARPDVPEAVELVLMRALSRHPSDRYESVEAFAQALAAVGTQSATTSSVPARSTVVPSRPARMRLSAIALVLLAVAGPALWVVARKADGVSAAAAAPGAESRVLAVLPFKNLGDAGDQYFADGLTEELTSRLAGLSELRVISSTGAEQYRDSPKSLKAIGAELQAGYVLEGSVRWERSEGARGRIRVTLRLIDVAADSPLWGQEYEVELTEVFRVQSEIARQVTTALDLALRASEQTTLAAGGGGSTPEAYDFYLRGNDYASRSHSRNNVEAAVDLYRKAVGLDPSFALAWARLGRAHAAMHWFSYDRSAARLDSARIAVESAGRLAPDLPEALIARGFYSYWGLLDYGRALEEFEAARRQQPSNSELLSAIGYVERRRGQWDSALARFQEAVRYDPRSALRTLDLADTYMAMRRYAEAEGGYDRAIQLAPDWAEPYAYKAMLYLIWQGDRDRARAVVGQALTRVSPGRVAQALLIPDAISASLLTADSVFAAAVDAIRPSSFDGDTARYHLLRVEVSAYRGDSAAARAHADSARALLESQVRERPDDAKLLARTGVALARAGRKAEAIRAGRRAAALLPPSRDANSGPFVLTRLAEIYTLVNEPEEALGTLEPLLAIPSWISPGELRSDPVWAPLRIHPEFARLAGPA